MKKLSLIVLAFLYLIPSIGFSVNAHYCGNKLASISLKASDATCACGSKKTKKNCCKNKTITVKISDTQQASHQIVIDFKTFQFQPLLVVAEELNFQNVTVVSTFYNHHPPDDIKQPLYILNRVFKI